MKDRILDMVVRDAVDVDVRSTLESLEAEEGGVWVPIDVAGDGSEEIWQRHDVVVLAADVHLTQRCRRLRRWYVGSWGGWQGGLLLLPCRRRRSRCSRRGR